MLGTSDLLCHSQQSSVEHYQGSFENAIRSINVGKRDGKWISLKINLNKRNDAFISEQ